MEKRHTVKRQRQTEIRVHGNKSLVGKKRLHGRKRLFEEGKEVIN